MLQICPCGSGLYPWIMYDARGISCGYSCEKCEPAKRAKYRPEIFTDADYEADEPIDEDY